MFDIITKMYYNIWQKEMGGMLMEVKWIKLTTDMFDNRKIKHLRKLPEGNNIVLIWVMLLTMAGRCNAGGMIFLTENIPYTAKMLADELDFSENTVKLALEALEKFGMIQTEAGLMVTNWKEYQNVDGMEKLREQNRKRALAFRERKRLECDSVTLRNVTDNVTVTDRNATDIDIEKDIEKERESKRFTPPTLDEVIKYCAERGNRIDPSRFINYYTANGWTVGKHKMKDWKAAIRLWEQNDSKNNKNAYSCVVDHSLDGIL